MTPDPSAAGRPRRTPGEPARPPFAFTMTAPPGWEALRGDAPSLGDDLLAVVARSEVWEHLDARRRDGLAAVVGGIARISAATGAIATLLHLGEPGADPEPGADVGDPAVSSITLTWLRTAPVRADLDLARLVLDGGEPVETGLGPALVDRRIDPTPTGGEQVTSQVAAPVPDSIWLALLTGTTTTLEAAPAMDDALQQVAASLEVRRRGAESPAPA